MPVYPLPTNRPDQVLNILYPKDSTDAYVRELGVFINETDTSPPSFRVQLRVGLEESGLDSRGIRLSREEIFALQCICEDYLANTIASDDPVVRGDWNRSAEDQLPSAWNDPANARLNEQIDDEENDRVPDDAIPF